MFLLPIVILFICEGLKKQTAESLAAAAILPRANDTAGTVGLNECLQRALPDYHDHNTARRRHKQVKIQRQRKTGRLPVYPTDLTADYNDTQDLMKIASEEVDDRHTFNDQLAYQQTRANIKTVKKVQAEMATKQQYKTEWAHMYKWGHDPFRERNITTWIEHIPDALVIKASHNEEVRYIKDTIRWICLHYRKKGLPRTAQSIRQATKVMISDTGKYKWECLNKKDIIDTTDWNTILDGDAQANDQSRRGADMVRVEANSQTKMPYDPDRAITDTTHSLQQWTKHVHYPGPLQD